MLIVDQVEHLRALSHLPEHDWLDLLKMTWKDYFLFRAGQKELSESQISQLGNFFRFEGEEFIENGLDYQGVVENLASTNRFGNPLPEKYTKAAHARCRTPSTSFDFLERKFGWRLKYDVLERFGLREEQFLNPFAPISTKLMADMTNYLSSRHFKGADFFAMGAYSYDGNQMSLIASTLSSMSSEAELYSYTFHQLVHLYEANCTYQFNLLDENSGLLTIRSIPEIAAEMGVKYVGSVGTCAVKAGIFSTLGCYIGKPPSNITHVTCEHKGGDACRFHIDFSSARKRA